MSERPVERLPFQLDEDQIHDLLEILGGVYCPAERIERFQAELEKGRAYFIDKRFNDIIGDADAA
jgi:hypothetical protein